MTPYPHQIAKAKEAYKILAEYMIVYLAMEERTGKTLTAILAAEATSDQVQNVLVITKKNAVSGWDGTLNLYPTNKTYTVTNYHSVHKLPDTRYDLVILDEAHNYMSSFPKISKLWHAVAALTEHKPIIYLSATPYAQGAQLLYHQFALSNWSPFKKFKTAYTFHRAFGVPDTVYLSGRTVETYKKVRTDEVLLYCKHLFVRYSRQDAGFEHEPTDKLHYIELAPATKSVYNAIMKLRAINLNDEDIIYDSSAKLRAALHMLEGGVAKTNAVRDDKGKVVKEGKPMILGNTEKIDYILQTWGDTNDLAIMYNYQSERPKLEEYFRHASLLQATSFAEGVDLSHKQHLVIYSQDWSTARHSQRRARQANMRREDEIIVHFLLVKDAISEQVYNTVSVNKVNFIDSLFQENLL
jgi:hypothetical protein